MSTSKIIPLFFIILCAAWAHTAVAQPDGGDAVELREKAYRTYEDFREQSLSLRLKYDYAAGFVSAEHKSELLVFAEDADLKLKDVYQSQRQLRADIEAYESDDWDRLYGVTGVWKSVYASEFETQWLRKEVAYYIAIASPAARQMDIADRIIGWCESDANRFKNARTKLLKAKASALIGKTSKGYKQQAMEIVEKLLGTKDNDEVYFRAMLLRFNTVNDINRSLLAAMAGQIEQSELSEDLELNVRVAFAGLKVGETKYLDAIVSKWPDIEKLIADIIFDTLYNLERKGRLSEDVLSRQSASEVIMMLNVLIKKPSADYSGLLERLDTVERFRCSLLSFALAEAYAKDNGVLAVEHYLAAAARRNIDKTLPLTKPQLAEKGVAIAIKLYDEDKKYCGIASRALLFYCRTAGAGADAARVTLYFKTLDGCLSESNANKQLQRLAQSEGFIADVARFEIVRRKIETDPTKENYINAIKVLADAENHCGYMQRAASILYDVNARVEEYAEEYPAFIDDCYFLAKKFNDCDGGADRQLELVRIELGLLAGADACEFAEKFDTIDDGSLDAVRCGARFLQAMGEYSHAVLDWKRLQQNNSKATYAWWQAKYYELWCFSQMPDATKADIPHAVEVLKSSYENIPPFWAKKLGEL